MIEADARGIHSHGLMRLPIYIQRIERGLIIPASNVVVVRENGATATLDANFSAGQVAAAQAMDLAIAKAEQYGIGAVSVRNSNHFGIAARYALTASRRNMAGIVMSNTAPLMPPTGGAEKILGNNPLAISVPTGNTYPLLLDMALSNAALGKILFAQTKGASIPEGWGADRQGKPTTDPAEVLNGGFILPVGGPKGFGLALMIELLTGVLADSQFSKMIPSMYDLTQKQSIAHFMLVINVAHFIDIDRFKQLAGLLSSYVKQAVKAEGVSELYLPGEIEFAAEEKRRQTGIPMEEQVLEQLRQLAESLQVPPLHEN
jgi:LDH2 family malate/lactate/ureidoglycolate dehydrogenase